MVRTVGGPGVSRLISPFNDVFNLITEGNEKALKQAFYNTIAILFILFVLSSVAAVYLVLQPFLSPLLWATLIGSVLHPFKRKLTRFSRWWLTDDTKRPISISVVKMPLTLVNFVVNTVAKIVQHYYKLLVFIFVVLLIVHLSLFYFSFTHSLFSLSTWAINSLIQLATNLVDSCNAFILSTLILCQLLMNLFSTNNLVQKASNTIFPFTFFLIIFKILSLLGTFGVLVFITFTLITLTGIGASLFFQSKNGLDEDVPDSVYKRFPVPLMRSILFIWNCIQCLLPTPHVESTSSQSSPQESIEDDDNSSIDNESQSNSEDIHSKVPTPNPLIPSDLIGKTESDQTESTEPESLSTTDASSLKAIPPRNLHRVLNEDRDKSISNFKLSNSYLYSVFWSCLLAQIWLRPELLYLTPVPIFLFTISWVWRKINGNEIIANWISSISNFLEGQFSFLHNSILTGFHHYYMLGDSTVSIEKLSLSLILVITNFSFYQLARWFFIGLN